MIVFFSAWAAAALITLVACVLLLKRGSRAFLDLPNQRSLHTRPIPRIGGLAMAFGIAGGVVALVLSQVVLPTPQLAAWAALALVLVILGAADDRFNVPVVSRFGLQLAVCAIACWLLGAPSTHLWWIFLALAWSSNLYNFMDGSDGLAGTMTVVGYGALGLGAWRAEVPWMAALCGVVVAAALAFLVFNRPRAKVFMGDAGSVALGFGAAAIGLAGWREGWWKLPFAALCFAPFYLDASFTLLRRLLRREKVWQAHRSHLYQRLILSGWSHGRLLAWASLLMLISAGAAHLTFHSWLMGFMLLVLWCVLMLAAATMVLAVRSHK